MAAQSRRKQQSRLYCYVGDDREDWPALQRLLLLDLSSDATSHHDGYCTVRGSRSRAPRLVSRGSAATRGAETRFRSCGASRPRRRSCLCPDSGHLGARRVCRPRCCFDERAGVRPPPGARVPLGNRTSDERLGAAEIPAPQLVRSARPRRCWGSWCRWPCRRGGARGIAILREALADSPALLVRPGAPPCRCGFELFSG